MAQSLANFDAALKNVYAPGLRNAINYSNPVLTEVVRDTMNVSGRKCIWAVHSGRSASTGARAEFGTLPSADRQRYLAPEDTLAYVYHTIKVSGQAKHLTQNDAGAFARALDSEIQGGEKDLKTEIGREMFNQATTINGALVNGAIAEIATVTSSTVLALDAADDADADAAIPSSVMRYFFPGMKLDAVTPSTGAVSASAMTVASVDKVNKTITLDSTTGCNVDDQLFRAGGVGVGAKEINGLRFLIGTQNYAGVSASSNAVWNANTVGSSTEGISENLLESAIEKVQTDGDGSTPTLAIAEQPQGRKLAALIQQQKRYAPPSTKLEAGWTGIDVAGLNLVFDRFCPSTSIFVLNPQELAWFVGLDWTWDDDNGTVLFKALDGSDAVEARFKGYVNLQSYTRNAHTAVTVAEPTF